MQLETHQHLVISRPTEMYFREKNKRRQFETDSHLLLQLPPEAVLKCTERGGGEREELKSLKLIPKTRQRQVLHSELFAGWMCLSEPSLTFWVGRAELDRGGDISCFFPAH